MLQLLEDVLWGFVFFDVMLLGVLIYAFINMLKNDGRK